MLFVPSFFWRLLVVLRRLPQKISHQKRAMYVAFHIGLHEEGESVGRVWFI